MILFPHERDFETLWRHVRIYMPWGFIIGGGIASAVSHLPVCAVLRTSEWDRGTAYAIAFGLFWLATSIVIKRLSPVRK